MSEGKGKGKEKGPAQGDEDGHQGQPEKPSMFSRVAASASGLAHSAFATPTSDELNDRAAAALADNGKGRSWSKPSNSAWGESSRAPQQQVHQVNGVNAFTLGNHEEHLRKSETEFSSFLDGIDSFTASEDLSEGRFASVGAGDGFGEAWARSQPAATSPRSSSSKVAYTNIAEQQNHDGEDVLAILSEPSGINEQFEPAPEDEENFDWGLSVEQISQLRGMTKDLFLPPEPHQAIHADNPLNLAPNFDGTYGEPSGRMDMWREQWDGVLNRYTDEVWGGLLPLVKEARREIEELRNDSTGTEQPKALRRLGAILGHLRKQ